MYGYMNDFIFVYNNHGHGKAFEWERLQNRKFKENTQNPTLNKTCFKNDYKLKLHGYQNLYTQWTQWARSFEGFSASAFLWPN